MCSAIEDLQSQIPLRDSIPRGRHREIALLLLCARRQIVHSTKEKIQSLVADELDWAYLIEISIRHGISPLLCHALLSIDQSRLPTSLPAALQAHYQRNAALNRISTAELIRILSDLKARGICAIPFKGPALAEHIYGDLSLRTFRDLDLLIRKRDISATLEALADLGYRSGSDLTRTQQAGFECYSGQYILFRNHGGIAIEPHWAFAPSTLCVRIDYDGIWKRAIPTTLSEASILTLSPDDLLRILCFHGSKEKWPHLKWICDVAEFLRAVPNIGWAQLVQRCRSEGCLRMTLLGLSLASDTLQAPLPESVIHLIASDKHVRKWSDWVQRQLFLPDPSTSSVYRISGFHWSLRESYRDKVCYVFRTLVTPRSTHFEMVRLPDQLFWLYYPIKLGHDYVLLPLWLSGKFILACFWRE